RLATRRRQPCRRHPAVRMSRMARRGGYRPPGDYDPRRGKKRRGTGSKDRGRAGAAGSNGTRPADTPAGGRAVRETPPALPALPARSEPPGARLDAQITRAADVAGATFAELGLGGNIVRALAELGATEPFAIQAATIPDALAGHHVLGRGRTGSG